jgi:predicted TIM-barrel fold metal-dependent hydrolase
MAVIDVQVHPFDRNHPGRPWVSPSHGLDSATGEEMVAAMDNVGVDGAIMVSSFSAYEYDPSYALEVYTTYPDKFRVVTPVDATDPAIDDVVANGRRRKARAAFASVWATAYQWTPTIPG